MPPGSRLVFRTASNVPPSCRVTNRGHTVSTHTFDETKHARANDGKFSPKVGDEAPGGVDALVADSYDEDGFSSLGGAHRDTGTLWSPPDEDGVCRTKPRELGESGIFSQGIRDAGGAERWVGKTDFDVELPYGTAYHYERVNVEFDFHENPDGSLGSPMSATATVTDEDGEAYGEAFDVHVDADPDKYPNRWDMADELVSETYEHADEQVREYMANGGNFF